VTGRGIEWSDQVEAADWIVDQLSDDLASIGWLVPRSLGLVVELVHGNPEAVGSLPAAEARVVVDVLRRHTSTPEDCWFGVSVEFGWSGHGPVGGAVFISEEEQVGPDADMSAAVSDLESTNRDSYDKPLVRAPARAFMLYRGPLEAAFWIADRCGWDHIPNLWWPEDRAWCVRTDIDLASTYVAGGEALIQDLLAESRLSTRQADAEGRYPPRIVPRLTR
jgi:hypothetical protein